VLPKGPTANNMTDDDPHEFIYQNLPQRHILSKVSDCNYCGTMRFQYEILGFCYRKEKVQIHIPEVPPELRRLFTSQVDEDAKYFRKRIRYLNSYFAFASLRLPLTADITVHEGPVFIHLEFMVVCTTI
jgi:hypothetical protein